MSVIFDILNEEEISLLKAFLKELFLTERDYISIYSLESFADMMFASILRYFEEFAIKYSRKHFIVHELLYKGKDYKYNYEVFVSWGRIISK